jgi:elongation factor G
MRRFPVSAMRNLALVGHSGVGKTSLAEAILYTSGVTDRLGRVDEGHGMLDHEPEEIRRQISISLGLAPVEWKERKLTLLDTPGFFDFAGEVAAALRVVESALLVVDASAGVQVGTELTYRQAEAAGVAVGAVVNKLDREHASFQKAVESLYAAFGRAVVPFHLPIGQEAEFRGVVDVVQETAFLFDGRDVRETEIPAELAPEVAAIRERLMELAAEADDDLTITFLEEGMLSQADLVRGLQLGIAKGQILPVFAAAATRNQGAATLLDALITYFPAPAAAEEGAPFQALVFKTTADPFVGRMSIMRVYSGLVRPDSTVYNPSSGKPERLANLFIPKGKGQESVTEAGPGDIIAVTKLSATGTNDTLCSETNAAQLDPILFPEPVYAVAVFPKSKGDEEKIGSGLSRLTEEDPTFKIYRDPITAETIATGLGDTHVDVMIERLKRKFGVEATVAQPKISYRETIRGKASGEYKHKKQSGGRGQYGHCKIEIEPHPDGTYEFVDRIFAGSIPINYRPAVDKGVQETMAEGVLAGYPVHGIRCTLLEGSYHDVDSSEMAFKIAARNAFRLAFQNAKPILLEPVALVEVRVPEAYMGDILGDMNKRRGRIQGMIAVEGEQVIQALVPQAEMHRYAIDLRSMTQGRGRFRMTFDHYDEVPAQQAKPIIEAAAANRRGEEE